MQNILIFDERLLQEAIDAISTSTVLFCFRCCEKGAYSLKLGFKPFKIATKGTAGVIQEPKGGNGVKISPTYILEHYGTRFAF